MTPEAYADAAAQFRLQISAMTAELRAAHDALSRISFAFSSYEATRLAYQGRGPEVQTAFANFLNQAHQISKEYHQ